MPQIDRLLLSALRNVLIQRIVPLYFGCVAAGSSAWSRTSAATIVHLRLSVLQTFVGASVNCAARFGLRDVGWVKWLPSFQGAIVLMSGRAVSNAVRFAV